MIYNLYEYVVPLFPSINFLIDGYEQDDNKDKAILLKSNGGDPMHWFDRTDFMVQMLSSAKSKVSCKQNIDMVYNELKNRFGLTLPVATVGAVTYPEIKTAQISPIQSPGYIGTDEDANHLYSVNFKIIVGG